MSPYKVLYCIHQTNNNQSIEKDTVVKNDNGNESDKVSGTKNDNDNDSDTDNDNDNDNCKVFCFLHQLARGFRSSDSSS